MLQAMEVGCFQKVCSFYDLEAIEFGGVECDAIEFKTALGLRRMRTQNAVSDENITETPTMRMGAEASRVNEAEVDKATKK